MTPLTAAAGRRARSNGPVGIDAIICVDDAAGAQCCRVFLPPVVGRYHSRDDLSPCLNDFDNKFTSVSRAAATISDTVSEPTIACQQH